MTKRAAVTAVAMALACGPERISHDDGGGTGSSGDPASTSMQDAEASSTEAPPPTIPDEGPYGAGTRLAPIVERTEDGVSQLVHWYDNELGIDCEFVRDSVGTPRCLPLEVEGVTVGFANEDCTEPAVGTLACATAPTHVRAVVPGAADCVEGLRYQAYLRGAPIGGGDVGVFSGFHGECSGGVYPQRHAATPIDDDAFVAAEVVVEPRGSVLVRALVAQDGAFARERLVDPRTGTACLLGPSYAANVDGLTCNLPAMMGRGFADDGCTTPLFAVPDDGTCEPSSLQVSAGVETWYQLGEVWDGPKFAVAVGGTCEPIEQLVFDAYSYRPLAEETTPIEGPRFDDVVADDPGRLRRPALAADGETLVLSGYSGLPDRRWFDSLLEQPCRPASDDEGTLRCFPLPFARPSHLEAWGDPECTTTPLLDEEFTEPGFSRITRVSVSDCGTIQVESLQNVVGPWDGPVFGASDDGNEPCVAQELDDYDRFYQLGNYALVKDAPVLELLTAG